MTQMLIPPRQFVPAARQPLKLPSFQELEEQADKVIARWHWKVQDDERYHRYDRFTRNLRWEKKTDHEERALLDAIASVRETFAKAREARSQAAAELSAWWLRQGVPLAQVGSAAVLQDAFADFLKQVKKGMPTKKALKPWRLMESVSLGRHNENVPLLDAVMLDFAGGCVTATHWQVRGNDLVLVTSAARCYTRVAAPFTVRVDFQTLRELVEELPPVLLDLRKPLGAEPLEIAYGNGVARLKPSMHVRIGGKSWLDTPEPAR